MPEKVKEYNAFLERKKQYGADVGFAPLFMPDYLFDFQKHLVDWALRKGRAALFADCGLGKTPMQLVWAENIRRKTKKDVLILTPLAVSRQTIRESEKFNIPAAISQDGQHKGGLVVTNYERLDNFHPGDFAGCVCDESSILKSFTGHRRKQITRFMNKIPYRLLCTATAAPNDYIELGTSSEALGHLSHTEMLKRFFKYLDDKGQKKEKREQDEAYYIIEANNNYYRKLSYRVAQTIGQWRLKHHAVNLFWRWVSSWARACRMPSDMGYDDSAFVLPKLNLRKTIIKSNSPPEGMLFTVPAVGLSMEREERRRTLNERCELVANLVRHNRPAIVWCHMNNEGDLLEQLIPDAEQISGRTKDERRGELYDAFVDGNLRVLVIKPKIGAWGLNWQHCNHIVTFASHSYEQYYQSVRRCWRFGQKNDVDLDIIATEGEIRVMENMLRKEQQANAMFKSIIKNMYNAENVNNKQKFTEREDLPLWLSKVNV